MFQVFEMKVGKQMLLPIAHPNQKAWDTWMCVCVFLRGQLCITYRIHIVKNVSQVWN